MYSPFQVKNVMKKTIYVDYKLLNSKDAFSLENELNNLLASGVDEILVKPVLMSDGFEARKLRERLSLFEGRFRKIEFGTPVLGSSDSINDFAEILIREIGFNSEFEYLLIGHGLNGSDNKEYFELSDLLHSKGFSNVEVACLTGKGDINSYLEKVQGSSSFGCVTKTVQVYPLMIQAGHHVTKDIVELVQILNDNGLHVINNCVPLCSFESFRARYMDESKNQISNKS